MFKRAWITMSVLFLPLILSGLLSQEQIARGVLRGQVTDADTGEILSDVQVVVHKASLGGLSNGSGRFFLRQVPLGRSTLVLEHPCYHSVAVEIDLSDAVPERVLNVGLPFDLEMGGLAGCDTRLRLR